jgi:hypothetical protein
MTLDQEDVQDFEDDLRSTVTAFHVPPDLLKG